MRGLWADEKVDRLNWSKKKIFYRYFKKVEKKLLIKSKSIVCLTIDAKKILIKDLKINKNKINIIPTCVNTNEFKLKSYKKKDYINFCHLGSIETAYNIDKVLKIFLYFLNQNSKNKLLFFTNQNSRALEKKILQYKIPNKNYLILKIQKSELIKKMKVIDIGIFYCNKNYSIQASFPTKIGEFLSSGIPILCNDFNKDIKNLINQNKIGLISNFQKSKFLLVYRDLKKLLNNKQIKKRCRKVAEDKLSLIKGSKKFLKLYEDSF